MVKYCETYSRITVILFTDIPILTFIGEMKKSNGDISRNGSIAYVAQQAWIQNLSLRDNILFGKDLVPEKYSEILDGCSLKTDGSS